MDPTMEMAPWGHAADGLDRLPASARVSRTNALRGQAGALGGQRDGACSRSRSRTPSPLAEAHVALRQRVAAQQLAQPVPVVAAARHRPAE